MMSTSPSIMIEEVRKTKKNEPKVFPFLLMVDKEAFGVIAEQTFMIKGFWKSSSNKLIVARKSDTKSIVGYAFYLEIDGGCYLMRIAVRSKCQRSGIGRKLMNYLFIKYPAYLSLDVNADNIKAVNFYKRIGLHNSDTYFSDNKEEFCKFETAEGFVNILNGAYGAPKEEEAKSKNDSDDDTQVSESDPSDKIGSTLSSAVKIVPLASEDKLVIADCTVEQLEF